MLSIFRVREIKNPILKIKYLFLRKKKNIRRHLCFATDRLQDFHSITNQKAKDLGQEVINIMGHFRRTNNNSQWPNLNPLETIINPWLRSKEALQV